MKASKMFPSFSDTLFDNQEIPEDQVAQDSNRWIMGPPLYPSPIKY